MECISSMDVHLLQRMIFMDVVFVISPDFEIMFDVTSKVFLSRVNGIFIQTSESLACSFNYLFIIARKTEEQRTRWRIVKQVVTKFPHMRVKGTQGIFLDSYLNVFCFA